MDGGTDAIEGRRMFDRPLSAMDSRRNKSSSVLVYDNVVHNYTSTSCGVCVLSRDVLETGIFGLVLII